MVHLIVGLQEFTVIAFGNKDSALDPECQNCAFRIICFVLFNFFETGFLGVALEPVLALAP